MIRMCIQTCSCFAALLTLSLGATPVCADEPLPETISFNRDIRPIFSDTCFVCHGPDAKHRKAKLRMDVEADAKADHDGYTPIVPGNLAKSEAWRLINADESERMPPPKSNKVLTARQKALIGKWIEQGAKYEGHWAFIAPTKPDLPNVTH